jgi:probable rRNA maturation factor
VRTPGGRSRRRRRQGPDDGGVTVFASDEQSAVAVDLAGCKHLAEQVLAAEGVSGDAELSLLFVDAEAMATLNTTFMGASGPTDVLAFPIDAEPAEPGRHPDGGSSGPDREPASADDLPLLLGDVVICPAVAADNAPDHAGTVDDELALLVVHGILHVLGHDHAAEDERRRMHEREHAHLLAFWRAPARDPWQAAAEGLDEGSVAPERAGDDLAGGGLAAAP